MSFQVNDLVYITPTGDPDIDQFIDKQMIIVDFERVYPNLPYNRFQSFLAYTVRSMENGKTASVLECEMEHRSNG